jgi:hypothetical protein
VFSRSLLVIISERKIRSWEYKEWGAAIRDDDAYTSLDELQEFNSTDLCSLFVPSRMQKDRPPGPTSRLNGECSKMARYPTSFQRYARSYTPSRTCPPSSEGVSTLDVAAQPQVPALQEICSSAHDALGICSDAVHALCMDCAR